jgi:PKD domain
MARFFTDVAADSGKSSNEFGVLRQYYDRTGFADYRQTFDPARQVILDTQPYPPHKPAECPDVSATYPTCISDGQIQSELQRLITAKHLPTAGSSKAVSTGRSAPARLASNAPIYFVILPADVAFCYGIAIPGVLAPQCTYSNMGGYHQAFDAHGQAVLYAPIATDPLRGVAPPPGIPGPCQLGGTSVPQEPNGDQADCVISTLLHEDSETITDPIQGTPHTGWAQNPLVQGEVGDECYLHGPSDPAKGFNPNAFAPTLGGSEVAGTLYTQEINGHPYYTQSVWSNGDGNCEMRPTAGLLVPRFHVRGHRTRTRPIVFNPGASKSVNTLSSATWNFGDRSKPAFVAGHAALKRIEHRYRRAGRYTVTLTLVDSRGNLNTTSQPVTIHAH